MDSDRLRNLLQQLQSGMLDVDSVVDRLKTLPFEDLGFAKIDNHRCIRTGVPEVIFCQGKTIQQIQVITKRISQFHDNIMATRANPETNQRVLDHIPANRWGQTQDLMGAAVFLASRASEYINGHILSVDGGYLVR